MEEKSFIDKSNGYVYIYKPEHPNSKKNGCIALHRYLMSQFLGRPLKKNEHVDHKDENKLNNKLGNLQTLSPALHNQKHKGIRQKVKCKICKKITTNFVYCSDECKWIGERRCKRPSKKQLFKMLDKLPYTTIAKKFGVTDNAVRKWVKAYSN